MILQLLDRFGVRGKEPGVNPSKPHTPYSELRTRVIWGQVFPKDSEQLVKNEQTLVASGIHSRRRAMDEVGVKDPEAEFKHWIEEQKEVMQIQKPKSVQG